jgi:hypothetical protein
MPNYSDLPSRLRQAAVYNNAFIVYTYRVWYTVVAPSNFFYRIARRKQTGGCIDVALVFNHLSPLASNTRQGDADNQYAVPGPNGLNHRLFSDLATNIGGLTDQ